MTDPVELLELLELSKAVAKRAGLRFRDSRGADLRVHARARDNRREIKARADTVLEEEILKGLRPTELSILSEESGLIEGRRDAEYLFIVDPLDGTYNFVKGLGPCAVSIALWKQQRPVFGVILSLLDGRLVWGGPGLGAFSDGQRITVSGTTTMSEACVCTGFPAGLDVQSSIVLERLGRIVTSFEKVRMLGSAAISLVNVATGCADAYCEQSIMLWDVAAGVAIVEGAGGTTRWVETGTDNALNVDASNGRLPFIG